MLPLNHCLQTRTEEVAAKVIDGEAIIINLANGVYYSMDKVGGLIWEAIERQSSMAAMIAEIVARYNVSTVQAEADFQRIAEELLQENLVTVSENNGSAPITTESCQQERLPYEAPTLNIYRDMGDLLALDPPTPGLQDITWKEPDDEPKK